MTGVISVLYNQKVLSGSTWNTLLYPALLKVCADSSEGADTGVRVILADNSTDTRMREENRRAAETAGAVFLDMGGNRGLPAAYNRAIDTLLNLWKTKRPSGETTERGVQEIGKENDWIVVTDQDTVFPENYLQTLRGMAAHTDCDVLAPVVKAGEKQLSPCCRKGSRFVPYPAEKSGTEAGARADEQEAFFINSGLVFRKTVFADPAVRYDEQLFLDFTDFDLINRLRARTGVRFGQLPGVTLQQDFSGTAQRTAEQDLERFRHFVHDGRMFYERWYGKGAAERAIRLRALKLAARYRDGRFLKVR